jgi:hypothetical protein
MVPLGTPAVAILYILTSRTRFRSWSLYRYRKHFDNLDHCSPGHQKKTDDNLKEMFAFIKRNKSDAKKIEFQYNKTINACT